LLTAIALTPGGSSTVHVQYMHLVYYYCVKWTIAHADVVLCFVYRVLPLEESESVKVQGIRMGLLNICGHEWQTVALYCAMLCVC